jgi:pSer/pThr/pTyr-binding forkhead associated (FHA) protein
MAQPPMPPSMQQPPMPPSMGQPPMPPSMQQPPPPPPPAYGGMAQQPPPPAPMGAPPPPPQGPTPSPGGPTLAAFYAGQRFVVNKDRFIIGRGKQSSDLTIKDPNVSRQHAMVEFLNGQYYMVDMGSTNGVEYNSQRIARKAIAEGDLYRICDHEVRFSYR